VSPTDFFTQAFTSISGTTQDTGQLGSSSPSSSTVVGGSTATGTADLAAAELRAYANCVCSGALSRATFGDTLYFTSTGSTSTTVNFSVTLQGTLSGLNASETGATFILDVGVPVTNGGFQPIASSSSVIAKLTSERQNPRPCAGAFVLSNTCILPLSGHDQGRLHHHTDPREVRGSPLASIPSRRVDQHLVDKSNSADDDLLRRVFVAPVAHPQIHPGGLNPSDLRLLLAVLRGVVT
jgi:hypothetical protein